MTPPEVPGATAVPVPAPGRRPSRRLRVLLAATAVVALTVPAALAFRGLTDGGAGDGKGTEAATGTAPVTPRGSGSGTGTGSASATPSGKASPAAGGSATATPSASVGAPARQGGGADDRGAPVSAVISSYNWESPCGQYYLLDSEPGTVPPPPAPQDTRSWAKALGGVDGGDMMLELTLQGASREAVVLKGLHVRVLGREPALAWTAYSMGRAAGAASPRRASTSTWTRACRARIRSRGRTAVPSSRRRTSRTG